MSTVAFIGLGTMGYPMAGHLARHGHRVTVFNRTTATAEKWCGEYQGTRADSPADAAHHADIVFTCVGNDNDLREVVLGSQGIIHGLKKNAVLVDHSTVSATVSRELATLLAAKAAGFIDAPVS